jgi:hypothetical protein
VRRLLDTGEVGESMIHTCFMRKIMNWIYKKTDNKSKGSKKNRTNTMEAVIFIHSCKLANEAEHKAVGQKRFPDVGFHVFHAHRTVGFMQ